MTIVRKLVLTCLLGIGILGNTPVLADQLPTFTNEQAAQAHCPLDTVVWVNLATAVYHYKGQRWYGNTKSGAYVCEKEAIKADDRPTKNGQ
jgi:hypothetical protein